MAEQNILLELFDHMCAGLHIESTVSIVIEPDTESRDLEVEAKVHRTLHLALQIYI